MSRLKVGIVGCGAIGLKRAQNLGDSAELIACADLEYDRALTLASRYGANAEQDWRAIIDNPVIDIVIVSTLHNSLAEITLEAVLKGKHVLVEKPGAKLSNEIQLIINACKSTGAKVRVGFNHRYHRAIQKTKELIEQGLIGELMFIRARYGHGARIGYESEWRANPALSGGGELIDQGPHLIDLSRWFMGEFKDVSGFAHTYYWDMAVDDNAFMTLRTSKKKVAFLHVSCTEWKNMFSMEIYGRLGKLEITGLGGSYGTEKLTFYKLLPEMGPPETTSWEYPMADNSWAVEMREFCKDIYENRNPSPGLSDAYEALKIVERIYKESGFDYCS